MLDIMLRQLYRFHGHGGLRYLHKNGRSVRTRFISLRYITNPRRAHSRVAVIVSKKVSKSAVKRNRIRRRVYEIVRLYFDSLQPHIDMVFSVHNIEVATMPALEVHDAVLDLLRQSHLYQTPGASDILEDSL